MTKTEGHELLTLELTAGEVYEIVYDPGARVDILNISESTVTAAYTADFSGGYIEIPPGAFYNSLALPDDELYLKSDLGGKVTIVRAV